MKSGPVEVAGSQLCACRLDAIADLLAVVPMSKFLDQIKNKKDRFLKVFKEWLRRLSRVQTGIFYLSIVLFFVLTVKHDPFSGYERNGSVFDPRANLSVRAMERQDNSDRKNGGRRDRYDHITSLSGYLMLCGVLALMTSGAIWLVGIRESSR